MGAFLGKDIAKWAKARIYGDVTLAFSGVCTDSRKLAPGELFIALKGENFDGHDYLGQAYRLGCRGMVVSRLPKEDLPGACLFLVEDTLIALQGIAAGHRSRFAMPIVGVTGSVGKTTTKEFIYSVLSRQGKTLKTQGNLNNEIGLPMSVLKLDETYWAGVFEMGMNHAGEMARLSRAARPTIGVITNIGVAHIENLGSREEICRAKLEIAEGMEPGDILLLNGDEPLLWQYRGKLSQNTLYFGLRNQECDFLARNIEQTQSGQCFEIWGDFSLECEILQKGEHNIYNALCAASLGHLLGLLDEKIAAGLLSFQNAPMRQNIYQKNGIVVIDDCYNANPDSMKAALDVLASMEGRKIAVLGDMLELGSFSCAAHEEIGRYVARRGISYLFLKGTEMEKAAEGARAEGMDPSRIIWEETDEKLAKAAEDILQKGDRVLFKGSRGMKIEGVLALILKEEKYV